MSTSLCNNCGRPLAKSKCVCQLERELVDLQYNLSQTQRNLELAISTSRTEIEALRQKINKISAELATDTARVVEHKSFEPLEKQTTEPVFKTETNNESIAEYTFDNRSETLNQSNHEDDALDSSTLKKTAFEESIGQSIEAFLGPLGETYGKIKEFYLQYKREKKLPLLLLTAGGVIITLLGLGFLLQYSFENWLGQWGNLVKIIMGFSASGALFIWSKKLQKHDSQYDEYGSALMGLSISANYLLIYFLGSLVQLSPVFGNPSIGFGLILINTVLAVWASLQFKTKIVASVSFLGGALSPFYLASGSEPWFYLSFLMVLTVGIFQVLKKIEWQNFTYIVFVVSTSITALVFGNSNISSWFDFVGVTLITQVYFMLFIHYALFIGLRNLKSEITRFDIAMVVACSSMLVATSLFLNSCGYGIWYLPVLINAVVFSAILIKYWRKINGPTKNLVSACMSFLWVSLAPMVVPMQGFGYVWALEGLFLAYMGFSTKYKLLRVEGYVAVALGFGKLWLLFNQLHYTSQAQINLILIMSVAILGGLRFLFYKNKSSILSFEKLIDRFLVSTIPLLLFVIGVYNFHMWLSESALAIDFSLAIIILVYAVKFNNKVLRSIAWGLIAITALVSIVYSALENGNIRFSQQEWYAQYVIILSFALLWFAKWIYNKLSVETKSRKGPQTLRTIFFILIPLILLPKVYRHYQEYFMLALAISFLANGLISFVIKKRVYAIESLLILLAMLVFSFESTSILNSALLPLALVLFRFLQLKNKRNYLLHYQLFEYSFWPIMFIAVGWLFDSILNFEELPGFLTLMLGLSLGTYFKWPQHIFKRHAQRITYVIYGLLLIGNFLFIITNASVFEFFVINIFSLFSVYLLTIKQKHTTKELLKPQQIEWMLLNCILAISFFGLTAQFSSSFLFISTVLLALQGIFLLLSSLNIRYSKLERQGVFFLLLGLLKLFFFDLNGLQTISKILVFTVTGLVMLVAAFAFIKLKKKMESHQDADE